MKRTRVKMCGITTKKDALNAIACGADALGFVFYPKSPRYISPGKAASIIAALPPFVSSSGLFVNENAAVVTSTILETQLDILQFHGDENENYCLQFSRPYYKALRMKDNLCLHDEIRKYKTARAILLDSYVQGIPGGTGQTFDWLSIPKNLDKAIILAGGLSAGNVLAAIKNVKPYAVDVSGGIEEKAGIKSLIKMQDFMTQVSQF